MMLFLDLDALFGCGSFDGACCELMVEGLVVAQILAPTVHISKRPWARH